MHNSIAALITNYNTWKQTRRNVDALVNFSGDKLSRIIVVDDASTADPELCISDKATIIRNSRNLGYVHCVNRGFEIINEDIVILLDSDAYPLMDIAAGLAEWFVSDPKIGAVGLGTVDEHNRLTGSYESEPGIAGFLIGQKLKSLLPFFENKNICLYSCGIAVRREAFAAVGGFDEEFDFLDADIDFSMRLRRAGWRVVYDPSLKIFHKGGGSPQTVSGRAISHHRNRMLLLRKHKMYMPLGLFKSLLAIRHITEIAVLNIFGRIIFKDPDLLKSKKDTRVRLLKSVWNNYDF